MMTNGSDDRSVFMGVFDTLKNDIMSEIKKFKLPEEGVKHVNKLLDYTIPGGKMNRGLAVGSSLRLLLKRPLTPEEEFKSNILGWCVEILQACFLVADDIMDHSYTRRGKPCWYKLPNIGTKAINDSFILESTIYRILKKYFSLDVYYVRLYELFHEITFQTELGQLMDLMMAPEDHVDLELFSMEKYNYIVRFKTAYYSFYLPVALAMTMVGITDNNAYNLAQTVLIPLGEYFQVQDDYLDCYGDPEVIGKIGTDIQDNKCSWLINTALSLSSPEQKRILSEHYGRKDTESEKIVKEIYNTLNLSGIYKKYEEESYVRIRKIIQEIDDQVLPKEIFISFMDKIYKRDK